MNLGNSNLLVKEYLSIIFAKAKSDESNSKSESSQACWIAMFEQTRAKHELKHCI